MITNFNYGAYIIDSACGYGKTTTIFNFICQHYNEGILYCVDTVAELNLMYEKLNSALVNTGSINADDIVKITSEQALESRVALHSYNCDPMMLSSKKILLITHVRFFSSMINYFLIYNPTVQIAPFDGDFQNLLSRPDLRQWIFFDETPMWIQPFCKMPRSFLGNFSLKTSTGWCCKDIQTIDAEYNQFIKDTPQDPFKHHTVLDALKYKSVLSMIPRLYHMWMAEEKKQDISIVFRPRDLVRVNMQTHILIFEGAADLILAGSQFTMSLSMGRKYNADIHFWQLPIHTKRGDNFKQEDYCKTLDKIVEIINGNTTFQKKTLVCVWQTSSKDDQSDVNQSVHRDWVRCYLTKQGCAPLMFDVIYYGENKCKSCNNYRDYSSIILVGKWYIPNNKVKEHNANWGTNITSELLNMWFYIQLICRIGIRMHQGGDFDVYMTDDFNNHFVNNLANYFQTGQIPIPPQPDTEQMLEDILRSASIKRDYVGYIKVLCSQDDHLMQHIINVGTTTSYSFEIEKKVLKEILSFSNVNFQRSCKRLKIALEKVNVKLKLT